VPGHHRTSLQKLDSLVRRMRPGTVAAVAFATVLLAAAITKVVVTALGGPGTDQPGVAAPPVGSASAVTGESLPPPPAAVATGSAGASRAARASASPSRTRTSVASAAPSATRTPVLSPQSPPTSPAAAAVRSYEAESQANTFAGGAAPDTCAPCAGGRSIRWVGYRGTLQFNGVIAAVAGSASVIIRYLNGDATRAAQLSVNGARGTWVTFPSTGGWTTVGTVTVTVPVVQGANRLKISNDGAWTPDFDNISVRDPAR
jgi:hypothetical protein